MSNLNPTILKRPGTKQRPYLVSFEDGTEALVWAYTAPKAMFSAANAAGLPTHTALEARALA